MRNCVMALNMARALDCMFVWLWRGAGFQTRLRAVQERTIIYRQNKSKMPLSVLRQRYAMLVLVGVPAFNGWVLYEFTHNVDGAYFFWEVLYVQVSIFYIRKHNKTNTPWLKIDIHSIAMCCPRGVSPCCGLKPIVQFLPCRFVLATSKTDAYQDVLPLSLSDDYSRHWISWQWAAWVDAFQNKIRLPASHFIGSTRSLSAEAKQSPRTALPHQSVSTYALVFLLCRWHGGLKDDACKGKAMEMLTTLVDTAFARTCLTWTVDLALGSEAMSAPRCANMHATLASCCQKWLCRRNRIEASSGLHHGGVGQDGGGRGFDACLVGHMRLFGAFVAPAGVLSRRSQCWPAPLSAIGGVGGGSHRRFRPASPRVDRRFGHESVQREQTRTSHPPRF